MHDLQTIQKLNREAIEKAEPGAVGALRLLSKWTNDDGITYEPFIDGHAIGYRITEVATARVEYIVLNPSSTHEVNPDNGATADTFIYVLDSDQGREYEQYIENVGHSEFTSITDFGTPVGYENHFERQEPEEPDPEEDPKYHSDKWL